MTFSPGRYQVSRKEASEPPSGGSGGRRPRVMIIYASAGAGHDGASRELARRLRERGLRADCVDLADIFPWGLGRLLRGTYHGMLSRLPWIYGLLFSIGGNFSRAAPITRALLRPVWPRVLRMLPPDTRAVVSTYPVVSQIVGPLRREGRLAVPVITYLTDFAVNPIWVSPGIDVHCAAHDTTRAEARALGAGEVRVAGRLVSAGFRPGAEEDKRRARERLGLPLDARLALLVAGSWGVGAVARTAAEIARTGVAVPVVVCGRNTALYRRLTRKRIGPVFGWVDDMPELLRAADVLVENAGGLTALEAMACGLPVVTYRPIPGHGRANAGTMTRAGVATWVRRSADLGPALVRLADGAEGQRQRAAGLALFDTDPAAVVADVAHGVEAVSSARKPVPVDDPALVENPVAVPAEVTTGLAAAPPRRTLTRWVGLRASMAKKRIGADEPGADGGNRPANRPDRQG
ncbi:glycosyltransferase [Plantactinospora soyae]|uniref:UDP-N-acetylglucosamine:LPS N-acetylglucosamine transferase n=1 Tax=Plantactinospora soyae TaxID=1544732 RepID=A0A927MBF2_9ACTN|nr:glycosyltransferase [Plantactinospora soyae]MBE1490076.1 UDP-N-acetylglucosamine:LPS N-acetylglucosamine transferase [Plantactinospora soyae]